MINSANVCACFGALPQGVIPHAEALRGAGNADVLVRTCRTAEAIFNVKEKLAPRAIADEDVRAPSTGCSDRSRETFGAKLGTPKGSLILKLLVLILFTTGAAAGQQPTPETKSDTIAGRVVNESGQPIAGASISVDVLGGTMGQRASSDNDGNFKIRGLDGGLYRLYLEAPGYVTQLPVPNSPAYRPGDKADLTMVKGAVIAGNVTNMAGDPVVNVQVRAFLIRDTEGNRIEFPYVSPTSFTDDRGYYRLWSLRPGMYVVAAGGPGQYFGAVNPYIKDVMTYAPASTRDTAAEIITRSSQEVTVDIHYRGERGHSISGKISGTPPPVSYNPRVRLVDLDTRTTVGSDYVTTGDKSFQMDGVADGEYEIIAGAGGGQLGQVSSSPKRITVRGADVTGLDLSLAAMAAIDVHVNLEADQKLNCARRRDTALREIMVALRRARREPRASNAKDKPSDIPENPVSTTSIYENVPNDKGDIRFRELQAATYRFDIRLPAAGWYLRDLSSVKSDLNLARAGVTVKMGDKVSGITIAIAEGGASLRGRIVHDESQSVPADLRVYLVPAERENADNPLRFFENYVAGDSTFAIGNIAPGKYWLIVTPAEHIDADNVKSSRLDSDLRARLLKAAALLDHAIVFKPCERVIDQEFRYLNAKP